MADPTITDAVKQAVITRLATINSATSILSLLNGRPAKVTVDEVLNLAERIEHWAWRDLLDDRTDARAPEKPADPVPSPPPAKPAPEPPRPTPAPQRGEPQPNGHGQRPGEASEKQINAIFGIGKSKGYSSQDLKTLVKEKFGKSVDRLTTREASALIDGLHAL